MHYPDINIMVDVRFVKIAQKKRKLFSTKSTMSYLAVIIDAHFKIKPVICFEIHVQS
jgi:hypothetical protein